MALQSDDHHVEKFLRQEPQVTIFLKPIAPPAALGLAGFAGSTFIVATWIAGWYGSVEATSTTPIVIWPYVTMFGGFSQFIAGLYGFQARDTLVTVINTMWGAFWIAVGILYLQVGTGIAEGHNIRTHFPELAIWLVVNAAFTTVGAIAAFARDMILSGVLSTLAIGCIIAFSGWFQHSEVAIKAAAYFWIISAVLAWWRTSVYLLEEAYGESNLYPVFRTKRESNRPLIQPGQGEPGVRRGMQAFQH